MKRSPHVDEACFMYVAGTSKASKAAITFSGSVTATAILPSGHRRTPVNNATIKTNMIAQAGCNVGREAETGGNRKKHYNRGR